MKKTHLIQLTSCLGPYKGPTLICPWTLFLWVRDLYRVSWIRYVLKLKASACSRAPHLYKAFKTSKNRKEKGHTGPIPMPPSSLTTRSLWSI